MSEKTFEELGAELKTQLCGIVDTYVAMQNAAKPEKFDYAAFADGINRAIQLCLTVPRKPASIRKDFIFKPHIDIGDFVDNFCEVETHDRRVAAVLMSARDYNDVRKWGRDVLDIESQAALLKLGVMGYMYGARILVSREQPVGKITYLSEPDCSDCFAVDIFVDRS